jgi:hypothetical protein
MYLVLVSNEGIVLYRLKTIYYADILAVEVASFVLIHSVPSG